MTDLHLAVAIVLAIPVALIFVILDELYGSDD